MWQGFGCKTQTANALVNVEPVGYAADSSPCWSQEQAMQLGKEASQCAFTLETTSSPVGSSDAPCVQGMRFCKDPIDRAGESTETDTLVTCRDLHLSHTFEPRCVVHTADRERRACGSLSVETVYMRVCSMHMPA